VERIEVRKKGSLRGEVILPGDKSISHRAVIIGSLAKGEVKVKGLSLGEDNQRTIAAFKQMGVDIKVKGKSGLTIRGKGLFALKEPTQMIDAGNSGTTMRLLTGLLSGQRFFSVISGDNSLNQRPMKRVIEPLSKMNAQIWGRGGGDFAPLAISGRSLKAIKYRLPVASAQVKSAIILAGLYAQGVTEVEEPSFTRDHTERMLAYFGAGLEREGNSIRIRGGMEWEGREVIVPGDISSAAFLIVAATIIPNSEITIRGVGINATRTGFLEILKKMGAAIEITNQEEVSGEPVADIVVRSGRLKGTEIRGKIIPSLIDEIPILSIAASLAEGETVIRDASELRVKETDRIKAIVSELRKFGVKIEEYEDGIVIAGGTRIKGTHCQSFGDHRMAMSLIVAGLASQGETVVHDTACIRTSFPQFMETLTSMMN
jgi:3-phosphoshikimate 1-carboxyvinyltransferase